MSSGPEELGGRVTVAEVARRLDLFREESKEGIGQLREQISGLSFVGRDEYAADSRSRDRELEAVRADLASAKDNLRWLARTVIAALVSAAVAAMAVIG